MTEPAVGGGRPAQPWWRRRWWALAAAVVAVNMIVAVAVVVIVRREPPVPLGLAVGQVERDNAATIDSLNQFWDRTLPRVYDQDFAKLKGGFQPKTSASPAFSCAGTSQDYDDIQRNAFYCGSPADDYIAWDAEELFPMLNQTFGSIAPAVALSHEMGHAIQARVGVQASSIIVELQADCFAGAWVAFAERSDGDRVTLQGGALDGAIAAILTLRDEPGTAASNARAHGSGFDRVNAFQTGYEQGAERCVTFATDGVTTTQLPFRTEEEARTGGNLGLEAAGPALADTLDPFWRVGIVGMAGLQSGATFSPPIRRPVENPPLPDCSRGATGSPTAQYCPTTNSVSWANSALRPAHDQIGDLATGAALADLWGRAGQAQAGLPVDGRQAGLQRDCMTGAWLASVSSGGVAGVLLSSGDIDEALLAIISSTFAVEGAREDRGDAFVRTQAFRAGLYDRSGACAAIRQSRQAAGPV